MSDISVEGLTALASVVCAVGAILTIGRLILHRKSSLHPGARWADYLNAAAAVLLLVRTAVLCHYLPLYFDVQYWSAGLGPFVGRSGLLTLLHLELALYVVFWTIMFLVKFSFLMLYRALFSISDNFRAAWWGVASFTVLSYIADVLSVLWMCESPSTLFEIDACVSESADAIGRRMIVAGAVLHIASDIAIMALPLGMLRVLQAGFAKKVGLAMIFLLACVDVAFDVARVLATLNMAVDTAFNVLEPALAVIVCALPVYGHASMEAVQSLRSGFSSITKSPSAGSGSNLVPPRLHVASETWGGEESGRIPRGLNAGFMPASVGRRADSSDSAGGTSISEHDLDSSLSPEHTYKGLHLAGSRFSVLQRDIYQQTRPAGSYECA